ncbi:ABC1 kinase family protein [Streptomyces sp. NPDC059874]|uniref:ABC1 kinase family protein n=1 Tax=Streptomyces sp. NPDC059874 TaxID=3346983 RepID=UPI003655F032
MELTLFLFVAALSLFLTVAALSVGARRLLGLRIGKVRAALTGLVGMGASALIGAAMGEARRGALISVQLGLTVLAAVGFLALSEVLVPSGSLAGVVRWPQAIRRRVARTRRYGQLSRIAMRHGLGGALRGRGRGGPDAAVERTRLAASVRMALEEAGATFVKLGQVLSTRYDLLPGEFVEELTKLQHQVAADSWEEVERVLTEELGKEPAAFFAEFDHVPLAAGSIAQVHRARLATGEEVVVKVQRPGARPVVDRDLDILFRMSRKMEEHTSWGRDFGAMDLAEGFANSLNEELDFRIEARNMATIRAAGNREDMVSKVRMPAVFEELCSRRVLVLECLSGVPLNAAAGTVIEERGLDRTELARQLLECVLEQIMIGGVFHADPHPGNIMLLDDGSLGLIDFGSVGRIDRVLRAALRNLLLAIHRSDPVALSDALLELVDRREEIDEIRLERALGRFMARHLTPGVRPDREMFADLFLLVARHGLTVPPEIAATFRALATLEGAMEQLVPGFDIVAQARSFAAAQLERKLSPGSIGQVLSEEALALAPMLRRLPRRVERITNALEHGRLGVQVRLLADERDRRFVRSLVHDVLLAFLGGVTGLIGVLLLGTDHGPALNHSLTLFQLIGYNLMVVSCVLVIRVVFGIFKAQRRPPGR